MNCPNKNVLRDFIDGELPESSVPPLIEHIRTCDACKTELREVAALHNVLNQVVDQDECPSLGALESYAANTCATEKISGIKEHIALCAFCRSYVWAFGASEKELADWQTQDELAYREFISKDLGYHVAENTLQKLLPDKVNLLHKAWESMLTFVLDLKDKTMENWPSFDGRTHLVGALGFTEAYDPETDAALIILATTLYVSQAVSDGQVKSSQGDIETAIKKVAAKLGAGKELQNRLVEIAPSFILQSK